MRNATVIQRVRHTTLLQYPADTSLMTATARDPVHVLTVLAVTFIMSSQVCKALQLCQSEHGRAFYKL
jgi:hypothetical protein